MRCKKACLVINPRAGENVAKLPDILAVLAAAGWSAKTFMKEYGKHSMQLATSAAEEGYDLVIAFGGDGTVNQVVNGVMNAKGKSSTVGLIPGGTANVWAHEIGVPEDPEKAALALINSDARKVDVGYVAVEGLTFAGATQSDQNAQQKQGKKARKKQSKSSSQARHHFLLMAGLGIDAAIMEHVSDALKDKIGPVAVGVAAAKELPERHTFPVEILSNDKGREGEVLWKGEAFQIVVGNTRKYANVLEMTPNAYIDDGILDVCVLTAGNPVGTVEEIASLILRRKPDNSSTEYFHGSHLSIRVPASVAMQLDGSAVDLDDYLSKFDAQALKNTGNAQQVMVTYRFDALPVALQVAIPRTYDDTLFEKPSDKRELQLQQQQHLEEQKEQTQLAEQDKNAQQDGKQTEEVAELVKPLLEHGRKVTVEGTGPDPDKQDTYIIAGAAPKRSSGAVSPIAVRIDDNTTLLKRDGEHISPAVIQQLQEGTQIVVEGKKNKRGAIIASSVVI